jgi:transposase
MKREITPEQIQHLEKILRDSKNSNVTKRVQCVLLRFTEKKTSIEISNIVGYEPASVRRIQKRYFDEGADSLFTEKRGGRHHFYMTIEQEKDFLEKIKQKALNCEIISMHEVHQIYQDKIGHECRIETLYYLFKRHGWKRIKPRPKHPNGDPEERAKFKENFKNIIESFKKKL